VVGVVEAQARVEFLEVVGVLVVLEQEH